MSSGEQKIRDKIKELEVRRRRQCRGTQVLYLDLLLHYTLFVSIELE